MKIQTVFSTQEIETAASRLGLNVVVEGDFTTVSGQIPNTLNEANFYWHGELKMNEFGMLVVAGIVNLRDVFCAQLLAARMNPITEVIVTREFLEKIWHGFVDACLTPDAGISPEYSELLDKLKKISGAEASGE